MVESALHCEKWVWGMQSVHPNYSTHYEVENLLQNRRYMFKKGLEDLVAGTVDRNLLASIRID